MESKTVREPIATWWKIGAYSIAITPVPVVAFTASFVTYLQKPWHFSGKDVWKETRERRDDLFPSFDEAKAEYIRRTTLRIESAKAELDRRTAALKAIESLTPPIFEK